LPKKSRPVPLFTHYPAAEKTAKETANILHYLRKKTAYEYSELEEFAMNVKGYCGGSSLYPAAGSSG